MGGGGACRAYLFLFILFLFIYFFFLGGVRVSRLRHVLKPAPEDLARRTEATRFCGRATCHCTVFHPQLSTVCSTCTMRCDP